MITSAELAERMKIEILADVVNGVVPVTVGSYSELHDYVDANLYGGTEGLLDELDRAAPDTDEGHHSALMASCDLANPAMDIVDAWIKSGAVRNLAPEAKQPIMKIAGGVDQARKDYDATLLKARMCIEQNQIAAAHDLLYEAEQTAYAAGLHDEAAKCRTAQDQLRKGQIPKMLTLIRETE